MKASSSSSVAIAAAALFLGCAHSRPAPRAPSPTYLRASPIIDHGPPALDSTEASPVEDDTEPFVTTVGEEDEADTAGSRTTESSPEGRDNARRPEVAPRAPTDVIARANAQATQSPDAEGFIGAIMKYTFSTGAVYRVFTAPGNSTTVILEPGEEIVGDPAGGDTVRWRVGVGTSVSGGVPQKNLFVTPTRAGLATNLTINTTRRTYFLRLESPDDESPDDEPPPALGSTTATGALGKTKPPEDAKFMVAVQWEYPESNLASAPGPTSPAAAPEPSAAAGPTPIDIGALNFDYAIEVTSGKPRWRPRVVYDNGAKTFIRFDASMLHGEAPALFVIERGELQIVNYRVKEGLYIVDRLFDVAELRLGQDQQDIVRIRNRQRSDGSATQRRGSPAASVGSPRRPGTPR